MTSPTPDDLADAQADMNAWFSAEVTQARETIDEMARLRREAAARRDDPMEMFTWTEGGNGDRFAAHNAFRILMDASNPKQRIFYIIDESGRWVQDQTAQRTRWAREIVDRMRDRADEIENIINGPLAATAPLTAQQLVAFRRWVNTSDKGQAYLAMATVGCESHGMVVNAAEQFDVRRDVIVAQDTLIELLPTDIRPRKVRPDDMVSFSTTVPYDPGILRHPPRAVVEYLNTFIPDTARERKIWKVAGSAMLGGNQHRLFVIVQGGTTTGKSQLFEAITAALGDYAGTGKPSVFRGSNDDRGRPDLLHLLNKRFVLLNEASQEWELHGDRVKDLTGGGNIAARALFSNTVVEKPPQFTPFMITNALPVVTNIDAGTKRRLMVIRFDQELPAGVVEDTNVKARFVADPEVRRWCLARLVQGYIDAAREGLDDCKEAFRFDTEAAFAQLSPVSSFLAWMHSEDMLMEVGPHAPVSSCITVSDMYHWYTHWVQKYGGFRDRRKPLGKKEFDKELEENHGWKQKKSGAHRWLGWQLSSMANPNRSEPFLSGQITVPVSSN